MREFYSLGLSDNFDQIKGGKQLSELIWKKTKKWKIYQLCKSCVRYIFASLFRRSKRYHLWNEEKCFLFHFESSFHSWDNQILTFQIFKCHDVIKCLSMKHVTHIIETSSRPFLVFKESSIKRILRRSACWFEQILILLLLHI